MIKARWGGEGKDLSSRVLNPQKIIIHSNSGSKRGGITLEGYIQRIDRRYFFVNEYEDYQIDFIAGL